MSEERPYVVTIPENFQTGVNIFGENYATKNVIEAGILAGIIFIVVMVAPGLFGIDIKWTIKIAAAIVLCAPCLAIGINGINGDSLLKFLGNIKEFKQRKRIILYNPRVKTKEVERMVNQYSNVLPNEELLPKEKIMKTYEKIKENNEKRNRERAKQQYGSIEDITAADVFFEEDKEYEETPVEYMSKSEYKEYLKKQKKLMKEQRKARRHGKKRKG